MLVVDKDASNPLPCFFTTRCNLIDLPPLHFLMTTNPHRTTIRLAKHLYRNKIKSPIEALDAFLTDPWHVFEGLFSRPFLVHSSIGYLPICPHLALHPPTTHTTYTSTQS